ncbi:MAG TPA: hypothetical protein VGL63_13690 [Streptosporangiaceae bacterium]|jgi:hypothetical protein
MTQRDSMRDSAAAYLRPGEKLRVHRHFFKDIETADTERAAT